MSDPLIHLKLPEDVRDEIEQILVKRCLDAQSGQDMRDQDLAAFDDQLNGLGNADNSVTRPPWSDPLIKKAIIQWLASVAQVLSIDPLVQIDAKDPNDKDEADRLEEMLSDDMREYDLRASMLDAAYLCARDPVSVMYVGWRDKFRPVRAVMYRDTETGDELHADEIDPERTYEPFPVRKENALVYSGYDIATPDLADVYLYPPNCQNLEDALAIFERVLLTEDDLLNGIVDFGYDEDAVNKLIEYGPQCTALGDDLRSHQNQNEGISEAGAYEDGFYECFRCYTRLPRLRDGAGRSRIPEYLLDEDMVVMLCAQGSVMFKLDFCPYDERPYIAWRMQKIPNRFQGEGHCQLLDSLQAMANAVGENFFENMEFETTPAFYATPEWIEKHSGWSLVAGGYIPREKPGEIEPIQWPKNSRDILAEINLVEQRADGLTSAPGYGALDPKQRRVLEMQNVMSATDAKFGLRLWTFMLQSAVQLAIKMLVLRMRYVEGLHVTAADLRKRFLFTCVASAQLATPEARLNLVEAKIAMQAQFEQATLTLPITLLKRKWAGYRAALMEMGERRPESWIGPEPGSEEWFAEAQNEQAMAAQQQAMAQMQALAQARGEQAGLAVPNTAPPPRIPGG